MAAVTGGNLSTPSGHGTHMENKAGRVSTTLSQLAFPLQQDIESAVFCDFDDMLRAFIFNCLTDDKVRDMEKEIEQLEQQNDQNVEAKRAARDAELNKILEECLTAVLDITRKDDIKGLLENYYDSLKHVETERYGPYVKLCNAASEELKKLDKIPMRPASDLVYRRLDPVVFDSSTGGTEADKVSRKPDVGCTDRATAEKMGKDLHLSPTTDGAQFTGWPSVKEFKKVIQKGTTVKKAVISKGYTIVRVRTIKHKTEEIAEAAAAAAEKKKEKERAAEEKLQEGIPLAPPPASAGSKTGMKRKLEEHRESDRKSKTPRTISNTDGSKKKQVLENQSQKSEKGRVQCSAYALEMMSSNLGRHHVINVLHIDDALFVWYYDRQGILRSNGINIFEDFPRFLVLLLVFQRFSSEDWGVMDSFNAPDKPRSKNTKGEENLPSLLDVDPGNKAIFKHTLQGSALSGLSIKYSHDGYLSSKPRSLRGRATRVLECAGVVNGQEKRHDLAIKLSYPEVCRLHEGEVLDGARNLSKEFDKGQKKSMRIEQHLPELVFYADVVGTETRLIRSLVNVPTKGYRVMRVVVMKRLRYLKELSGLPLICAWLDALTCHAFLWRHGVEHGDPSLYNVMYDPETKRGVLTDFDLSLKQWAPRVPGTDRTGTVPFMALDLLSDRYWDGHIIRRYHHELEAFIWILPYLCLLETEDNAHDEFIKKWTTGRMEDCCILKRNFLFTMAKYADKIIDDNKTVYNFASLLCDALEGFVSSQKEPTVPFPIFDIPGLVVAPARQPSPHELSKQLWDTVVRVLQRMEAPEGVEVPKVQAFMTELIRRLKQHEPKFSDLSEEDKKKLADAYGKAPGNTYLRTRQSMRFLKPTETGSLN